MAIEDPQNIELDVGRLWAAPAGTTLPTGNTTAQAGPIAGFRQLGFTEDGTTLMPYKPTITPIYVEELYYPARYATEKVEGTVDFVLVEMIRANLMLAVNRGANATNDTTSVGPPAPGQELPIVLMWESTVIGERWVFPSCIQINPLSIERRKAPDKSKLPVSFALQQPAAGDPWVCWPATVRSLI